MIRDFLSYDGTAPLACDICIAGAGAAGISMALHLAGGPQRVLVLEGGGLDFEDDSQDLYQGAIAGRPYHDLTHCRLRYLGGATNHWGGMCTPLEPIDFEARPWVPDSGWPIGHGDLQPWYAAAHPLVEIHDDYDRDRISPPGTVYLEFDPARLRSKMWRFSLPPTAFGQRYRKDLERAPNVEVLLHANVTEVTLDPAGRSVQALQVASLAGQAATVRAKVFVLALGGLENPRLLLNSDGVMAPGVGNGRDLVGRYFMEHINAVTGTILSRAESDWAESYRDMFVAGRQLRCLLVGSRAAMARAGMLHSAARLGSSTHARERSVGYDSLHRLRMAMLRQEFPSRLGSHLWNVMSDLDGTVMGLLERFTAETLLYTEGEQAPNPDSRVYLLPERDALGQRRLALDWRLCPLDKQSLRALARLVGEELGRLDVARLQVAEWLLADDVSWPDDPMLGAFHHMGTTRMAASPAKGVVDGDCRVFGIGNLYLAGSSVFPTGGCANPTLTLIALALRLADHLRQKVA